MKILFVDVEWNPDKDRRRTGELLEIGVVGTKPGCGDPISYFSYIRPKRMQEVSKAQLEFLGIEASAISTAPDATTVLRKVVEDFSGYDLLVIWSTDAYQVLSEALKRRSFELKAGRTLILQDIIKLIVRHRSQNKPGFSEMLMNMGLDVKECGLHDAMNDAENLRRLYEFLVDKVSGYKINDHYFRKSAGSDVLHVRKCHYCRKIRHENMERTGPVEILKGARLCLPWPKKENCFATQTNKVVIAPDGSLHSCVQNFQGKDWENDEQYWHFIKELGICEKCQFLPICLGGCVYNRKNKNTVRTPCVRNRYIIKPLLKLILESIHLV